MMERMPPKLASWLLNKCGSPYHGESLAGDLIEQYQEGKGRAWYWRQVIAAILIAWGRLVRAVPWTLVYGAAVRAVVGFIASIRPNARHQRRAAIMAMLLAFGVIAAGVGTLVWAGSLRGDACLSPACVRAK